MTQNDTVLDVKKELTVKAYANKFGNISEACRSVGIERKTFYRWKESDPEFKAAIENAQPNERFLDFLENKAAERIEEGSDAVLIFALKTKGKSRGWAEKTQIELSGKTEVLIVLDEPKHKPLTSEKEIIKKYGLQKD